MSKRKLKVGVSDNSCPGNCLFLRIPGRIFSEMILQLLSFKELMKLDCAITNHALRKTWWLSNEKKPLINAEGVLRYAIDEKIGLPLVNKKQAKLVMKLGLRSSHLRIDLSDIDAPTMRKVLEYYGEDLLNLELLKCTDIVRLRCVTKSIMPYLPYLKSLPCSNICVEHMLDDNFYLQGCLLYSIATQCTKLEGLVIHTKYHSRSSSDAAGLLNHLIVQNPNLENINISMFPVSSAIIDSIERAREWADLSNCL